MPEPTSLCVGRDAARQGHRTRAWPTHPINVGKESNRLEEVEAKLHHDPDLYVEYAEPTRDAWRSLVVPVLERIAAKRPVEETGLAMSTVKAVRNGHTVPHGRNRAALTLAASACARERLREPGITLPVDDLAACAAYRAGWQPSRNS